MSWTKQEQELIAILDDFLANCSKSEKLKNTNYHLLLEQLLLLSKGEVAATKQYCQQILGFEATEQKQDNQNLEDFITYDNLDFYQSKKSSSKVNNNFPQSTISQTIKFKSFWTLLFLFIASITVFFTAKKDPNLSSVETFSNIAMICPANLIETAKVGIKNREESLLKYAIANLQQLKTEHANQLGTECEQVLWETQFIYAIDFLASQGQTKKAVKNLCEIAPQYYQSKEVIPWFTRWSNTNQNFRQWLNQYKAENKCSVASYLE